MKEKRSMGIHLAAVVAGIFLLTGIDQFTKYLAVLHLKDQKDMTLIPGIINLHYLENRGAAFGIMQNQLWFFVIAALLFLTVAFFVFIKMPRNKRFLPLHIIAVFVSAGAIGNIVDRLRVGYVIDFLEFSFFEFPIFNVADIYVTLSSVFIFLLIMFYYKEEDFSFLQKKEANE